MNNYRKELFGLGKIVQTKGITEACMIHPGMMGFVVKSLVKYARGNWGDTGKADAELNDNAVISGEQITASYTYPKTRERIWITTKADRSMTTILCANEG